MLNATVIPVTAFAQNCSVVWCERTRAGAVIDPGGDLDQVLAAARENDVRLEKILLTHAHIDHAGGTAELARSLRLPIEGPHRGDQFWIDGLPEQARMFGLPGCDRSRPTAGCDDGDTVQVGEVALRGAPLPRPHAGTRRVLRRPTEVAFVGDVLFAGSIGRTDFPGGDYDTLIRSIRDKLLTLGDDVRFVPGHGPMSTFGEERRSNPFLK